MAAQRRLASLAVAAVSAATAGLAWSSWTAAQQMPPPDHAHHMQAPQAVVPTLPGQDAFGAVQEIVRILEADPQTDWRKVDLAGLREHLIDMNDVTLRATAVAHNVDNGVRVDVTGEGRTLDAIRRMLPAHGREIDGLRGWSASTESLANGVRLTVTAGRAEEVAHIRGLGFIGLMASGAHHQPHHLAMARGEDIH